MDERENLPAVIAAQAVAVLSEQRGSLVGRGLMALRKDNDALYRHARAVFDRGDGIRYWKVAENPAISSAFKIFQQLADENYGKSYYPLSILYGGKRDIEKDQDRAQYFAQLAFGWCFANRSNQDVELWCDLGVMYKDGCGVERDNKQAVYWFRKAAEQGDADGQCKLGLMYSPGGGGGLNNEQAVYWFRKAAEQGDAYGQLLLGLRYKWGVEQNVEQAMYWFHKAAEQGKAVGLVHIGEMYFGGVGVEKSDEQGVYWFRKAAEQGDADGQFELGILYAEGRGVAQDYKEAVKWYRLAAEQGFVGAYCNLGALYEYGIGVPQDLEEAVKWYQMAADYDSSAQKTLIKLGIDWKK